METFYLERHDIEITIFLTLFSSAFGIFYYLVLKALFKLPLKPAWPLFVVPPVVVILTALYHPGYVPFACLVNFPILLLLMIIGGIYKSIRKKRVAIASFAFFLRPTYTNAYLALGHWALVRVWRFNGYH
ncbi:hypothetical protein ACU8V7_27100 [Zobellia nedashkovskayae]